MAPPPKLLFVCIENSCRSQMAEGFARFLGGSSVEAWSAGSRPSGRVNPRAIAFMAEKKIDLEGHRSKGLDDLPDAVTWDFVVTMGCGDACPHLAAGHRLDWDLHDPKELSAAEFRAVRDDIERRVSALVEEAAGRRIIGGRERAD